MHREGASHQKELGRKVQTIIVANTDEIIEIIKSPEKSPFKRNDATLFYMVL